MAEEKIVHPDQQFITALLDNDGKVIDLVYQKFGPGVKRWILHNNGSISDAGDIFQEALITMFRQARENDLQLTCPFEAYLFLIVKRMWLNELKKRGRQGQTIDIASASDIGTNQEKELEETMNRQEQENCVMAFFETLGERCQQILRLCLRKGHSQEAIAQQLGVSYAYLRKKKSLCIAQLIKKVQGIHP